jgi:hypothetical protein
MSKLNLPRPCLGVTLPGGGTVHVRELSIGELDRIDKRAEEAPEGDARNTRLSSLIATYALANPDGTALFPDLSEADVAAVADTITPSQLKAIAEAAVVKKDAAKN